MKKLSRQPLLLLGLISMLVLAACGRTPDTAQSLVINNAELALEVGDTAALEASLVYRSGRTEGTEVTWQSSNTEVASISEAGLVSAIAEGAVTITATHTATSLSATAQVKVEGSDEVEEPEISVSIAPESLQLLIGTTGSLTATVEGTDDGGIKWSVTPEAQAIVELEGKGSSAELTALAVGTVEVTATSTADSTKSATVTVEVVTVLVELDAQELDLVRTQSVAVTATVKGAAGHDPNVTWSTTDAGIAAVVANGNAATVSAAGVGEATITATSAGDPGVFASLNVNVTTIGITIDPSAGHVFPGQTIDLTATLSNLFQGASTDIDWTLKPEGVLNLESTGSARWQSGDSLTFRAVTSGEAELALQSVQDPAVRKTVSVVVDAVPQLDPSNVFVGGPVIYAPAEPGTLENPLETIQEGVDAAEADGTVHVYTGTYAEQIVVEKNVSIVGAGRELTNITSPATWNKDAQDQVFALLYVLGEETELTASGLTFHGPFPGGGKHNVANSAGEIATAVSVEAGATLNLSDALVRDTNIEGQSGVQFMAISIFAGHWLFPVDNVGQGGNVNLENVDITGSERYGIVVAGKRASLNYLGGSVVSDGPTPSGASSYARNGIGVFEGAAGTLDGVTIEGFHHTTDTRSTALFVNTVGAVSVSDSTFTNNDIGINRAQVDDIFEVVDSSFVLDPNLLTQDTFVKLTHDVNGANVLGTILNASGNTFIPSNPTINDLDGWGIRYVDPNVYVGAWTDPPLSVWAAGTIFNPFETIQQGVDAVIEGGTVNVAAGTYGGTTTISIDKPLNIIGESEASVIIDQASLTSGYGIHINADDVHLSSVTVLGPTRGDETAYGFKVEGPLTGFELTDVTVKGSGWSEIDLNRVDGATLTRVTADGSNSAATAVESAGAGIALSGSRNITLADVETRGNEWAGVVFYSWGESPGPISHTSNVNIIGGAFDDFIPLFSQLDYDAGENVSRLSLEGFNYAVRSSSTPQFTAYLRDLDQAGALAALASGTATIQRISPADAAILIDDVYLVPSTLPIQTAIDAVDTGATIEIHGTHSLTASVKVDEQLDIRGANNAVVIANNASGAFEIRADGTSVQGLELNLSPAANRAIWLRDSARDVTLDALTIVGHITDTTTQKGGGHGITIESDADASGFELTNSVIRDVFTGLYFGGAKASSAFDDVTISNLTIDNAADKGLYISKISNAVLRNLAITNSGNFGNTNGVNGAGISLTIENGSSSNVQIIDSSITDSGASPAGGGAALTLKLSSGDSFTGITIQDTVLANMSTTGLASGIGLRVGDSPANANPAGVVVNGGSISGARYSIFNTTSEAVSLQGTVTLLGDVFEDHVTP